MVHLTARKLTRGFTVYVEDVEQGRAWSEDFLIKSEAITYANDAIADAYNAQICELHDRNAKIVWK